MVNKNKKQERKERLDKFRNEILPVIERMYKITSHGPSNAPDTMYKITIHSNLAYDYYPMSEKVRRAKYSLNINDTEYQWSEVKLEHLIDSLKKLKR
jgi:hypothetical protein